MNPSDDDLVLFDEGPSTEVATGAVDRWQLLVVDDDPDVHAATEFALADLSFLGKALQFLHAYSARDAAQILAQERHIAVVLLDVVMENEHAGLELVGTIRQTLGLSDLRIILRTGQPGYAPEIETIRDYDINDYKNKSELTRQKLYAAVATAIRSYQQICQLNEYAFYDRLCQLPNRNRFMQRLASSMEPASAHDDVLAIVDIDDFSSLNDVLGYQQGDRVLQGVAERLQQSLGPQVMVARINSDVFAVLGPATLVGPEALRAVFCSPFEGLGTQLQVTCSMGLLQLRTFDGTADDAMQCANIALKHAKGKRHDHHEWFLQTMGDAIRERVRLQQKLRAAFENAPHRLYLVYQPKVQLQTGRPYGAEVLLRWRTEDGQHVPPDKFIQLAEYSGLIVAIGEWVLRNACAEIQRHAKRGRSSFHVAVNVSAAQLRHPDFVTSVDRALTDYAVPAALLELEITESIAAENYEAMVDKLQALKRLGVSIAIDDFGTGYSSLSHLRHMPVDRLKIDRSFVNGICRDATDRQIAAMVIDLGRNLALQVIAEGVETREQADLLTSMGCHEGQGYLFARPMAAEALDQWLDQPQ